MSKSPLQLARYEYEPKLPTSLRGTLASAGIEFGPPTESVDNQGELKQLFRHTYGKPAATFVAAARDSNPDDRPETTPTVLGVVSGARLRAATT